MYCSNCGNKVDENAYVCVHCGVVLKKRSNNIKYNNNVVFNIISLIISIIAMISSLSLFLIDISDVGMYTKISERIFYGIGFTSISISLTILSLILALINKKNKVSLILTFISIFLILSEIFVIVIY
ncbi:MAG: zinc ribbon domain-containing protein [Bacilli bacterium]